MLHATFTRPDLTTFARLDELGLEVVGQYLEPKRAVLACRVVDPDQWCRRCGCEGTPRGINDPNDWGREHDDPRYIVDLVKRVTRVSVETMRIVDALPELPI